MMEKNTPDDNAPGPSPKQIEEENVVMDETENDEDTLEACRNRAFELLSRPESLDEGFDAYGYYIAEKLRSYTPIIRRTVQEQIMAAINNIGGANNQQQRKHG